MEAIALGIITLVLAVICCIKTNDPILTGFSIGIAVIFGGVLHQVKHDGEPQAIDVYRNKTTLKVTYQDSIVIDSVVVFKK